MKNKHIFLLLNFAVFFLSPLCFAQPINLLPRFKNDDRILILAPHPDDESIGTAGIIQRASGSGSKIKVVLYTNGDSNELSFIVYEKRLTIKKMEIIHMGEVRRKESAAAMEALGLQDSDLVSLGYPDFGTMEILTGYWHTARSFKSLLTRVNKVSYPESMSVGAPYVGESILNDLKQLILDFRPTKIFVSHPADTNRDHRSLYLFLRIALWDLDGKIKQPEVLPYIIHVVGWPMPRGLHSELELAPPEKLKDSPVFWNTFELSEKEINKKKDAISFYKSQIEYNPPYLFSFARQNELFGDYPPIELKMQTSADTAWQDVDMFKKANEEESKANISGLAYALKDKDLLVRLTLRRKIDKDFGITVHLLGYSKKKDFSLMPKLNIALGLRGIKVRDKFQVLAKTSVKLRDEKNPFIITVPLSLLGDPDYVLGTAKTTTSSLDFDDTAWRILKLE